MACTSVDAAEVLLEPAVPPPVFPKTIGFPINRDESDTVATDTAGALTARVVVFGVVAALVGVILETMGVVVADVATRALVVVVVAGFAAFLAFGVTPNWRTLGAEYAFPAKTLKTTNADAKNLFFNMISFPFFVFSLCYGLLNVFGGFAPL